MDTGKATSRETIEYETQRAGVTIDKSASAIRRAVTYLIGSEKIAIRYTNTGMIWSATHEREDGTLRAIHGGLGAVLGTLYAALDRRDKTAGTKAALVEGVDYVKPTPAELGYAPERPAGQVPGIGIYDALAHCSTCQGSGETVTGDAKPATCSGCGGGGRRSDELALERERGDHKCPNYSIGIPPRCPVCGKATPAERLGDTSFGTLERAYRAEDQFATDPQRVGSIGPAVPLRGHSPLEQVARELDYQAGFPGAASEREPAYAVHEPRRLVSVDTHGPASAPVLEIGRWDPEEESYVHVVSLTRQEAADLIYELAQAYAATSE